MAYAITDKQNIDAPSADYPFGRPRDKTISVAGTPSNLRTNGDWHQFFAKLMDYAGVTPNGLPDNEYSGFQLMEALLKGARPYKSAVGYLTQAGTAAPVLTIVGENNIGAFTTSYSSSGVYAILRTGAFTAGKTWVMLGQSDPTGVQRAAPISVDGIFIYASGGNGTLNLAPIEIRVYEDL
jgi:hypothetical protein